MNLSAVDRRCLIPCVCSAAASVGIQSERERGGAVCEAACQHLFSFTHVATLQASQ